VLTKLADAGLVSVDRVGNQKYYQANRASPVFDELHGLIVKTSGLLGPLRAGAGPARRYPDWNACRVRQDGWL